MNLHLTWTRVAVGVLLAMITWLPVSLAGEDAVKSDPIEKNFRTVEGLVVMLRDSQRAHGLSEDEWPAVAAPTTFNKFFGKPANVWPVVSGYLASFEAGEFGGSLFYADARAKKWSRILRDHVQWVEGFGNELYLAVGGLAHGDSHGQAHLVFRSPTGTWKAKMVFQTNVGKPMVIGCVPRQQLENGASSDLIVIGFDPKEDTSLFGIDRTGTVRYLGKRPEVKK